MGYPREIYQQASAVLSARRQQANEQTLMHRREIYALLPQIEKYDKELAQIGMKTIQAVAGSPDQVETIIERLKQQSLGLQKQRDDLLAAAGLLEVYRDDGHTCKICKDSGYVGSKKCECFLALLREAAFDFLGATRPQDCRFENFSLDYYSPNPLANGVIPYQRMSQIKKFCIEYAQNFSADTQKRIGHHVTASPSLLFWEHRTWQDPSFAGDCRRGH